MKPVDQGNSKQQVTATAKQLAGDLVHLRGLKEGILDTLHVINRAAIAYRESKELLARLEAGLIQLPQRTPSNFGSDDPLAVEE